MNGTSTKQFFKVIKSSLTILKPQTTRKKHFPSQLGCFHQPTLNIKGMLFYETIVSKFYHCRNHYSQFRVLFFYVFLKMLKSPSFKRCQLSKPAGIRWGTPSQEKSSWGALQTMDVLITLHYIEIDCKTHREVEHINSMPIK